MDEPDRRGVAGREHRSLRDAIQASDRSAQTPVGQVTGLPCVCVVLPMAPAHPILVRELLVRLAHACALDATELLDTALRRRLLPEPECVHLPDHLEAQLVVQGEPRLKVVRKMYALRFGEEPPAKRS